MNQQNMHTPDSTELRKFGLVSAAIVIVLFGLLLPWIFDKALADFPRWPWYLAAILACWALVHPASLIKVYRPWMAFGLFMGAINSRIILSLVYYLMITPIGLIMHLFGRAPLKKVEADSYRTQSEVREPKHMEHPY